MRQQHRNNGAASNISAKISVSSISAIWHSMAYKRAARSGKRVSKGKRHISNDMASMYRK